VSFASPPNNLDWDGEDDFLELPEDTGKLAKEQVDALDNEFADEEFHLDLWRDIEGGLKDILARFQNND
jgi:hypothetical protein